MYTLPITAAWLFSIFVSAWRKNGEKMDVAAGISTILQFSARLGL
jgi:hypothetical protein